MTSDLVEWLTKAALSALEHQPSEWRAPRRDTPSLSKQAHAIAEELAAQALASGLVQPSAIQPVKALHGGAMAAHVAVIRLTQPFVFKMDQELETLAQEARVIRAIQSDERLPDTFRAAWPKVFAIRTQAPWAYLMEYFPAEDGWTSLRELLYPAPGTAPTEASAALRLLSQVLDLLFSGYMASVDQRSLPHLRIDYVERIKTHLRGAAKDDRRFRSQPLAVNGQTLRPWADYLAILERHGDRVQALAPPFRTVLHGDCHPGNILLRTSPGSTEIRLIDPKSWHFGDYLFDVAKIVSFLEYQGPRLTMPAGDEPVPTYAEGDGGARLDYDLARPSWATGAVEACLDRVRDFAQAKGDPRWAQRYPLVMAAILLGMPLGRFTIDHKPRPDLALVLYGEGLGHLHRFCRMLEEG